MTARDWADEKAKEILHKCRWGDTVHNAEVITKALRDAHSIAHSRQDIPDLITALDERDAKIQRMRKALKKITMLHCGVDQPTNAGKVELAIAWAEKALSDDGEGE